MKSVSYFSAMNPMLCEIPELHCLKAAITALHQGYVLKIASWPARALKSAILIRLVTPNDVFQRDCFHAQFKAYITFSLYSIVHLSRHAIIERKTVGQVVY